MTASTDPTCAIATRIAVSQPSGCFPECYLTQRWFTPIGGEIYSCLICVRPLSFLREGLSWLGAWWFYYLGLGLALAVFLG